MKILTFNVRNRYRTKNYDGIYKNKDTVIMLSKYIKENNIDVICLQEVIESYRDRLTYELKDYTPYGNPRMGRSIFTKVIDKIKRFNESVNIYTNLDVSANKNYRLPFLPDLLPRVATRIDIKNKNITIINTHLSAYNKISKNRQLKKLYKIIKKINNPIILLGDFNMNTKSNVLTSFIKKLELLGINHMDIQGRTFKKSKRDMPIDHIFISNSLKVKSIDKITDKEVSFSDHYPILLEISDAIK